MIKNNKYLLEKISNKNSSLFDSTKILSDLTRRDIKRSVRVHISPNTELNYSYNLSNSLKKL